MRDLTLRRRVLILLVVFALLAVAPSARAQDDEPAPEPTPDPTPEPTPAEDPAGDESPPPSDGGDDEEEEEEEEPRCAPNQVDLTPDAEEPNCIGQARLARLLSEFEAAAAEEAVALAELSDVIADLEARTAELEELTERLAEVQIRQGEAEVDVRFAAIRVAVAQEGLGDVEAALADEEITLEEQAVRAYIGGDSLALEAATGLLEGDSPTELSTAREYASVIITDQLATIEAVDALRKAAVELEIIVSELESEATDDADRAQEIEDQAVVLLVAQRDLVRQTEDEAAELAERIADIQARKADFAEELNISGAGGGQIGSLLSDLQADQVPPADIVGFLDLPLAATRIGSGFGPRVHPIFEDTRLHTGMDMSGPAGANILAAADGVVVMAEEVSGYGNLVVIDHGNTLATLYAHMTADAVTVGDVVERGDLIGFVGSTGFSTGPHLHFELRVSGQPIDPLPYLDVSS